MYPSRRGLSLLELMAACAIGLMLLTAATLLFSTLLRKVFWIEEASDRQLIALNALQSMRRDLLGSASEGVAVDSSGLTLSIAQQDSRAASIQRLWLSSPVLYGNQRGQLVRAERPSPGPPSGSPATLGADAIAAALASEPGWQRRTFASLSLAEVKFEQGKVVIGLELPIRNGSGTLSPQRIQAALAFRL